MKKSSGSSNCSGTSNSSGHSRPYLKFLRYSPLIVVALFGVLFFAARPAKSDDAPVYLWEPEIVRLSFAQGDVRLSRGGRNGADLNTSWETAKASTPMQEGFTIA